MKKGLLLSVVTVGLGLSAVAAEAHLVNINHPESPATAAQREGAGRLVETAAASCWAPVEFSLFTPAQLPWGAADIRGVRFGIVYADNPSLEGVDFGIVGNVRNHVNGLQACIFNLSQGNGCGIQAGVVNYVNGEFSGWQQGVVAFARSGRGFQCGFYNGSENFTGVQLGIVNTARRLYGMQFGLVNIVSDSDVPFLPMFNWYF